MPGVDAIPNGNRWSSFENATAPANCDSKSSMSAMGVGQLPIWDLPLSIDLHKSSVFHLTSPLKRLKRGIACDFVKCGLDTFQLYKCAGANDGTHKPVTPPALNHTDYYNRKSWYSVILQAVVDHRYAFRDINVGWPGSVHDARVLDNSSLFKEAENGVILRGQERVIEGYAIPVFLIGNSAYPLLKWLLKPFPQNKHLSERRKISIINSQEPG
ncbi:uncharacterized protein LOC134189205 [Corticium candelabrum]|uniref:uncharacterized protein LOC134189205 n=1 Tax=Corticium candelabrum TaxID=121492 RepID=UPI002E26ACF6|nr:uncharacterized protein LOC134189205 [Corticium candelabrum]